MKSEKRFNIIGIGEILWDIYEDEKFLGGAPANFAIHCQQLGDNGIIVSRVGDDELGVEIISSLQKRELETIFIQQDSNKPTGTVKVTLDKNGKPRFECTTDVAFDYLQMDTQLNDLAQNADAILFGTLAQRNNKTRVTIQYFLKQSVHTFKIYDINLRGWDEKIKEIVNQSLILTDAIKINDDELHILKNVWQPQLEDISFLRYLIDKYNLKFAALTLGENGCILVRPDAVVRQKGIKIKPVDTTGCGDAFAAALIYQYLREKSFEEIALVSNLLGAYVALFPGATPEYSISDLLRFKQDIAC
ncbi:MAG: carbohydrate kinase [bacterium]|nr:MAG: carbohydrate kinase [bacterium]